MKKICVISIKGGVGKSLFSVSLAKMLRRKGKVIGLLDMDLSSPCLPYLAKVKKPIEVDKTGFEPAVTNEDVQLFSIGLLLSKDEIPIMIRGMKRSEIVEQICKGDIKWGKLDYLIIDTCAGVHEETLTLLKILKPDKTIIISQPNDLSLVAAKKTIRMLKAFKIKITGIVENMAYFECPKCHGKTELFSGSIQRLAKETKIKFLASIPFVPHPEILPISEEILDKVM